MYDIFSNGHYKKQDTTACGDCDSIKTVSNQEYLDISPIPTSMSSMLELGRERRKQWRAHHAEFKAIMKRLRGQNPELSTDTFESSTDGLNLNLQQCKHCGRKFTETAYNKHTKSCREAHDSKSYSAGVTQGKIEAMARFRSRMKCKPTFRAAKQYLTISSQPSPTRTADTEYSNLSPTSTVALTDQLTDSRFHDPTTTPSMESSYGYNEGHSPWDSAGQSSNCNHTRVPQEASATAVSRITPEMSLDLDKMPPSTFNTEASSSKRPPLCDIPSPSGYSSPSTASSLSTVSVIQGHTCEILPASCDQSLIKPDQKTSHCPWSPCTSSFAKPMHSSDQNHAYLRANFMGSSTASGTGNHPVTPVAMSGMMTFVTSLTRTSSLCAEQDILAPLPSVVLQQPTTDKEANKFRPSTLMGRGCSSAHISVQCNLFPRHRHRHKCRHMHKSCSRDHSRLRPSPKQATYLPYRLPPSDSDSHSRKPRLVEGDIRERPMYKPLSVVPTTSEAQLVKHKISDATSSENFSATGIRESFSYSGRPSNNDPEKQLFTDENYVTLVSVKEDASKTDWVVAQVGKAGDLIRSESPQKNENCLVIQSKPSSVLRNESTKESVCANNSPINSPSVKRVEIQPEKHSVTTDLKGPVASVLRNYLPGFPTALALTKAMLHHPRTGGQVEPSKSEHHLTVDLDESDVDEGELGVDSTSMDLRTSPRPTQTLYCYECGARYISDRAKYCSGCGTNRPISCVSVPLKGHFPEEDNLDATPATEDPVRLVDDFRRRLSQATVELCSFQ